MAGDHVGEEEYAAVLLLEDGSAADLEMAVGEDERIDIVVYAQKEVVDLNWFMRLKGNWILIRLGKEEEKM